jgi:hypothetical protein
MTGAIAQTPASSEILDAELHGQPSGARLSHIIGLILQIVPVRWWFARDTRSLSESDLSNIPVYPGAQSRVML